MFGSILIEDKEAINAMKNVDKKGKDTAKGFQDIAKKGLGIGLAVGGAAVAAGGALMGLANKASETTDRVDKMSQKLGMSRKGFQEWDYAMSQSGVSIDSMGAGMKAVTNQFDDMGKGGKKATDSFNAIGLSFDDLKGKTQEEIFDLTVKGLQGVEDTTVRAALANDLLGRSGAELAPILNAGAEEVDNLKNRAHELGLVMSDESVDAGVLFGDTMDDLKSSFGMVFTELGVQLIPILQQLAEWIIKHMPEIKQGIKTTMEFAKVVIEGVVTVVGFFIDKISKAVDWVNKWNKTPMYDKNANVSVKTPNTGGGGGIGGRAFAEGTSFAPGGLSLVGERGPELVNLPRGSQVFTNEESRGMMGVNVTGNTFVIREEADIEKVARKLHELTQRKSRAVGVAL